MTIDELNKLSGDELNRLVADRVMRFSWHKDAGLWVDGGGYVYKWNPSTDYNDAALVRAEIERRSLQQRFCRILAASTPDQLIAKNYWWHLCDATPRETCIAALLAVEAVK